LREIKVDHGKKQLQRVFKGHTIPEAGGIPYSKDVRKSSSKETS
jgi:hypothetical protein